ncbi:MAG: DUF2461 domain-containing protein [Flavobacteriaceae bacterium]|nr:DUF2461 domain-containing protein [Flavobacteriaceae bacterium]
MSGIQQSTVNFLKELKSNNNREWFAENKERFLVANDSFISFADDILLEMNKIDSIETISGKKSVFRIYRDVRFSKNKTPYKNHFSGSLKRATEELRGGYYFHVEPGNSFIGGGFWGPNPKDLLRIRKEININAEELIAVISTKKFISNFGNLQGETLKTAPRGFDRNHANIELLRLKQFIVSKKISDEEILGKDFSNVVVDTFKEMRPFFDYMSSVLTTDENGVSIYP